MFRRSILCSVFLIAVLFLSTQAWGAWGKDLPQFTKLAKQAGDAVVNISTVKVVETSKRLHRFFSPFDRKGSPFDEFFDRFFEGMPEKRKRNALGSGFIISKEGYIVTNNHVIEKADQITVNLKGGEDSYPAEVVGTDPETDLALLKIEVDQDLPVLEFGDSQTMEVGQWVVAIGNPFGLDHTVTAGILSAKGRVIGAGPYDNFLQTDASINPGNSGGPLLNLQGKVIGINSAIVASGQGIGFAIPSNMAKEVIGQLKKYQKVKRGWLGVTIQDVDEDTAKALGLSEPKGALVASVNPGDPAAQAGIQPGDIIVSVNGEDIEGASDLTRTIGNLPPGETIDMTVWRQGDLVQLTVTLGERSLHTAQEDRDEKAPADAGLLGMEVKPVNAREAEQLGLSEVKGLLVVDVASASEAAEANIQRGDVILEANKQPVNQVDQLQEIINTDAKQKGALLLRINRRGQIFYRAIPLE